jgi:hypothetical protein
MQAASRSKQNHEYAFTMLDEKKQTQDAQRSWRSNMPPLLQQHDALYEAPAVRG